MVKHAKLSWDEADGPSPLEKKSLDNGSGDRLCHLAAADFPGNSNTQPADTPDQSTAKPTQSSELRKQISIFVPLSDWKAIRLEAARRGIPMTELCRRWMGSDLSRLRRRNP